MRLIVVLEVIGTNTEVHSTSFSFLIFLKRIKGKKLVLLDFLFEIGNGK